jgi:hypothetical protein
MIKPVSPTNVADSGNGATTRGGTPDALAPASPTRAGRLPLWIAALIGLALVVMPFAFQMFDRAPQGATMLKDFHPFMTAERLDGFQREIGQIHAAVLETNGAAAARFTAAGVEHPGSGTQTASYAAFAAQWPAIHSTMTNLLDNVQNNLGNYRAVAAMPSFTLFPWFFVIPGLIVLAAAGLALWRPRRRSAGRLVIGLVGIGLVLAPVAFQMFSRAPAGGRMMSAFKTIETTSNVEKIQGYFSSMAIGQGAIRLDIVPSLQKTGLTATQMSEDFPAITALDQNWIHILNDMTPMIGAMSNSVPRYQAIAALPPFALFPWFFVIPGLALGGLALFARPRRKPTAQPLP